MSYKEIKFMNRSDAQSMQGSKDAIFISVTSPGMSKARISAEFRDVLYLEFDNTERLSNVYKRISGEDAKSILNFVKKYNGLVSKIMVNCVMGESRSTAIALFLAEKFSLPLKGETKDHNRMVYHMLEYEDEMTEEENEEEIGNKE